MRLIEEQLIDNLKILYKNILNSKCLEPLKVYSRFWKVFPLGGDQKRMSFHFLEVHH